MPRPLPRYTREQAEDAVERSRSYAEALRKLGMSPVGGNHRVFRHWVDGVWRIPTDHFDSDAARLRGLRRAPTPLEEVMVERSTYDRGHLKRRLLAQGIKQNRCEMCGQRDEWRGARMAMILDHINGIPNDHRIENLRILCPNCAATLATHCGRKNGGLIRPRNCDLCGATFEPKTHKQRFCSTTCGSKGKRTSNAPRPGARKVERPPYERLIREIEAVGYAAVGRRYGVSDNAVRKWVRAYERARHEERASGRAA